MKPSLAPLHVPEPTLSTHGTGKAVTVHYILGADGVGGLPAAL